VSEAEDVTPFVNNRMESIAEDNDNADTDAIKTDDGESSLNFSESNSVTLSADGGDSRYHLSSVDMDSKELVIDTNGDEVEIAVAQDLSLDNAKIRVTGNGTVRLYVGDDLTLQSGSNVTVPDERAEGMWVYGTGGTDVSMEGDQSNRIRFVGVVYATGKTDFDVKHMDLYGGVIAGEMDIGNGGSIHYDAALQSAKTLPTGAAVPRVTYLHVSETEIRVEND
jgi:hypothetical protein